MNYLIDIFEMTTHVSFLQTQSSILCYVHDKAYSSQKTLSVIACIILMYMYNIMIEIEIKTPQRHVKFSFLLSIVFWHCEMPSS